MHTKIFEHLGIEPKMYKTSKISLNYLYIRGQMMK